MRRVFSALAIMFAALPALAGDIYVRAKVHTDAMKVHGNTIPAKDEILEQWIGDGKMAHIGAKSTFIVDLNKKLAYIVNPKHKSYVQAALPIDLSKLMPAEMASMMGMMKPTVTVGTTGQSKKIGNWNCQAYDMSVSVMGTTMKTRIWATKDTPIDLSKYRELYASMLKGQFMDEAAIKEMEKIEGFHILSETDSEVMGSRIRSTVLVEEISQKNAPPGAYDPPAGYSKREQLTGEDLQR